MSTKHLRRLLKEKEERERAEAAEKEGECSDGDGEVGGAPIRRPQINRFALLEDDEQSENDSGEERSKQPDPSLEINVSNKNKKNKKKKKGKGRQNNGEIEEDGDELLDKLVHEMSLKKDASPETDDDVCETAAVEDIFKVDRKLFDPTEELKKLLGKALRESGTDQATSHKVHKAGWGRIVKAKRNWLPAKSCGLSMEVDAEHSEFNEIKWWKFAHNENYEKCERLCWLAEDSFNHELLNEVLYSSFYHLNALLMTANMYRMQEDMTQCCDAIERGIYYCETVFHPLFQVFCWQHRLDYEVYENRALFLLLHRHMLNVVHKRCFKTALNVAKLLFGLDPQGDPLGVLLLFDTIAIKAKEYAWLKTMYHAINHWKKLDLLPNYVYSIAMAEFLEGNEEKASELLKKAIVAHPTVVTEILNELQIQADPEIDSNKYFKTTAVAREPEGLQLLVKVYVKQAAELWKVPEVLHWLEEVTRSVVREKQDSEMERARERRSRIFSGEPPNLSRLAILLGLKPGTSGSSVTNPVPPAKSRQRYSREPVQAQHVDGLLAGLLHSLHPEFDGTQGLSEVMNRMVGQIPDYFRTLFEREGTGPAQEEARREDPGPPGDDDRAQ